MCGAFVCAVVLSWRVAVAVLVYSEAWKSNWHTEKSLGVIPVAL